MFRCVDITNKLLANLYADPQVSEVILIDNSEDVENINKIIIDQKLQIHSQNKNIFVNPAWNLGVSIAKEDNLAILNDDITIPEGIFTGLAQIDLKKEGILGACFATIQTVDKPERFTVKEINIVSILERTWAFGVFMVMHKDHYVTIPEDMQVWCGDDYLYHQNRILGRNNSLMVFPIQTRMSTTSDDPVFDEIKNRDVEVYNSKYKIMNITKKHGFKVKYDQFGRDVEEDFYDKDEWLLIEAFEKYVLNLKETKRNKFTMIELGSNQAYYSMLFKAILKEYDTTNIMVEPTDEYMERGKHHFNINSYDGIFINKCIGKRWIAHSYDFQKQETSVDQLIEDYNIEKLDVLHSDIDGAEFTMLEGAYESLKNKKIEYAFILTHSLKLHEDCLKFVLQFDYDVLVDHREDSVGADRLIIIKSR
jgi:hypothetical protein